MQIANPFLPRLMTHWPSSNLLQIGLLIDVAELIEVSGGWEIRTDTKTPEPRIFR